MGPPTLFTIPVLRYMKTYGLTHEQLGMVSVLQREWAAKNPRVIPGTARQGRPPGDADHRRGCAELADDRLPVPLIAVLSGHRWRQRQHPKIAILAWYVVG